MKKQHFFRLIGLSIFLILSAIVFIGYAWEESYDKMVSKSWTVQQIIINGKDVTNEFNYMHFKLTDDDKSIFLPFSKHVKYITSKELNTWEYYKTGWFSGNIRIYDYEQQVFSGDYQIEILEHNVPQWVKLYSDSIEIHLLER